MLLAMRQEEGESRDEAIAGIVRDNLHGLEIDPRCIQIAGFAVAMEAWKAGFPTDEYLPLPNLACVGLPIRAEKEEWLKLAGGDGLLEGELEKYYDLFKNADSLGSLIQIEGGGTLVPAEVLMQKLEKALAKEKATGDPVAEAFGETASGVLKAVQYLRRRDFHIVVTNPPFLGKWRQTEMLQNYLKTTYLPAKNDIATCFITRSEKFSAHNGYSAFVSPLYWLTLTSYSLFREKFLPKNSICLISALGPHAFESISGEVVKIALFIFRSGNLGSNRITIINCQDGETVNNKIDCIHKVPSTFIDQNEQRSHLDSRILLQPIVGSNTVGDFADSYGGLQSGDYSRYIFSSGRCSILRIFGNIINWLLIPRLVILDIRG
jgi:N-6 DNA Methylase.